VACIARQFFHGDFKKNFVANGTLLVDLNVREKFEVPERLHSLGKLATGHPDFIAHTESCDSNQGISVGILRSGDSNTADFKLRWFIVRNDGWCCVAGDLRICCKRQGAEEQQTEETAYG